MKKMTLSALFSVAAMISFAQNNFIIHGKITLLTASGHVRLSGFDPVPVKSDGTFEIEGKIDRPRLTLISTDSAQSSAIWLEPGEYSINCKETHLPGNKWILFRTPYLKGPADAELYNDCENRMETGFGAGDPKGRDLPAMKELRKKLAIHYMDSVLKGTNSSPVLPNVVRFVSVYASDEATKKFIEKLNPELRSSWEITSIEGDIKRKEKIKTEKTFENFSLQDTTDNNFTLAALSGKKALLIDFWASDCGPCRLGHSQLKEWYTKYAAQGLQIISISIDTDKTKWVKAIREDGIGDWINVCDFQGFNASLMRDYYIPFIPFRFLLDKTKSIVLVGNMSDTRITEKDIALLLAAP